MFKRKVARMSTWKIAGFVAAAAAVVGLAYNYGDLQRYIKIELM